MNREFLFSDSEQTQSLAGGKFRKILHKLVEFRTLGV